MSKLIEAQGWAVLRRFTAARIALGRVGDSVPTAAALDFSLAHALARDAVHAPLDVPALEIGLAALGHETLALHSAAADRAQYLRRPDLGRRLEDADRGRLRAAAAGLRLDGTPSPDAPRIAVVIGDGLSAVAVQRHAVPLLCALKPHLDQPLMAPLIIATQARVALGDEIGELLGADQIIMLIGERPGLSAHDSLGVYLTHGPRIGRTDAERNCISNVRPQGLSYDEAAQRLALLLRGAQRLGASGVLLKADPRAHGGFEPATLSGPTLPD
jgi:ethanolamine ammonia-lyase small subunit